METKHVFRVVLASPGDVQPERDALQSAISIELNQLLRDMELPAFVELYRWETDAYPGLHKHGPQGLIDSRLKIEDSDVLIAVFWTRFGTPVGTSGSGTEHEIRRALDARKRKGSPQVMLYFRKSYYEPVSPADKDQFRMLQEFKAELQATEAPAERPLIWEYEGDSSVLVREVQSALRKFVLERLRATKDVGTPMLAYSFSIKPIVLRSEGITELIGNGFLSCKYNSPVPPERPLWFSAVLSFTTQVTSRLDQSSGHAFGEPFVMEIGRPGAETVFVKGTVSGNQVAFGQVHLRDLQPFETRIFQIGNIRCNASGVGGGSRGDDWKLIANVSVSGAPVGNDTPVIGMIRKGFDVLVQPEDSTGVSVNCHGGISELSQLFKVATLRFIEGFGNAFKSRMAAGECLHFCGDHSVYAMESYSGPMLRSSDGKVPEAADSGTRLRAVFRNVPVGVRLFVPVESCGASSVRARLADAGSTLLSAENIEISHIKIRELLIREGGFADATWEVVQPSSDLRPLAAGWDWEVAPGCLEFPIFACVNTEAPAETVLVNACFAPASTVTTASSSAPIPRFFDTSSARVLFRIRQAQTAS
jgi:hypothetical protein